MRAELYLIDGVPCGKLAIMPRPRAGDWLAGEIESWQRSGINCVVSLLEPTEVRELGLQDEPQLCEKAGLEFRHFPIPDRGVPHSGEDLSALVESLVRRLREGRGVAIHCRIGVGRSALVAACVLVALGRPIESAWQSIQEARGFSVPDTPEQCAWVTAFSAESQRMPGKLIIETERLWLREYVPEDAAATFELGRNAEVLRYTGGVRLTSPEEAREMLCKHPIADYRKHGFGRWGVVLKATGRLIGFAGLKYLDELREVDVGYRLLPEYWGSGLATEAARASVCYGFETLRLSRIIGLVDPKNTRSVRVLEKTGLSFERTIEYAAKLAALYSIHQTTEVATDGTRITHGPDDGSTDYTD